MSQEDSLRFFETEDAFLRTFWDPRGKHHWGLFEPAGCSFSDACDALDRTMVKLARLDADAVLLDVGCGNGVVAAELCATTGCRVVGIDLSQLRIDNARRASSELGDEIRARLAFECASATELPFGPETFSHAWSQATLFRVPDRASALREVHRVLVPGGRFVMEDICMPKRVVSAATREHVYDRWNCDHTFSFEGYQEALRQAGLVLLTARDLSPHLARTFSCLRERTESKAATATRDREKYARFASAYGHVVRAVEQGELGWGLFLCEKPAR